MTTFPAKISFLSDKTEVFLVEEINDKKLKERMAEYKYSKGKVFKGSTVTLGLSQIEKLKQDKLILCQEK